ncbi:MAG: phosphohistidine phosphatase SixA [Candidatus Parabeggiatoa sp. nov. 3]|nr:MAG: phosphohistidine phosphatase SixA [Gammaproteobacteria bacterium]RKZ69268.1 MAG: phosphohistidine phosphatase SixA [Gammaproteobacteria bacterium]RKZ87916.1 MAG: phosphohistidine phosphatase SixA [Gammaproteobacteria bacterium]
MQVLIVRHAPAEDREAFARSGQSDELRPLSNKGKAKMLLNSKGLQTILPTIHRFAESPLIRAEQTADLLASAYPNAIRKTLPALAPDGSDSEVLSYLQQHANTSKTIALVGHEPDLGELATWLLSGEVENWMPLKKGAACLLEFRDDVEAGQAELCWMLRPKQLRQLAI